MKVKKHEAKILIVIMMFLLVVSLPAGAAGRIVVDMSGRQVRLPDRVERVVTTYKSATQFVFALGAEKRLAAVDMGSPGITLFQKLMPEISELPTVGSRKHGLNLEEIISTRPDLVILFPYEGGPETARKLEQQGIASLIIRPESLEEIRETNLLLGEALDLQQQARLVNREYDRIMELTGRVRQVLPAEKKRVYFANSGLLDTVGGGMMQTALIEAAGGINPAAGVKQGFLQTSPEELISWNPDLVIVSQFFPQGVDQLLKLKQYSAVDAFREGKIFRIPSQLEPWDHPSPSSYLAIVWLACRLYPGRMLGVDLEEVIDHFYLELYGKTFSRLAE